MALHRVRLARVLTVALTLIGVLGPVTSAGALSPEQSRIVSAVPPKTTPNIDNGIVYSIVKVGKWMVAAGSFTKVTSRGSTKAVSRPYVVAFDPSTGKIDTAFAPHLDNVVRVVLPGPTANSVYVGGEFTKVNGAAVKSLTLLNLNTGARVKSFHTPTMNGQVFDLRREKGHLWLVGNFEVIGGTSHKGIVTLNPTSGAVQSYIQIDLVGHHNDTGSGAQGPVGGRALDINAANTRAVIIGNFTSANGAAYNQIVRLDLRAKHAVIDANWNTQAFSGLCKSTAFDSYVEDVEFSPDGSWFAIAATGGGGNTQNDDGTRSLCDSVSRWRSGASGSDVQPTWVDYSGNDTFWSVAVTGTAIYAGGHARWVNNPNAADKPGTGAVPRPGIVALDPLTGLPFSWNPGRNPRGGGAHALYVTAAGLYVGSDTNWIGNRQYLRKRIAFFPLKGGAKPASTATATLPADLYLAGPTADPSTLQLRHFTGSSVGDVVTDTSTGFNWSKARGVFRVGNSLFWMNTTNDQLQRAPMHGTKIGSVTNVNPYDDPKWENVPTGSGQTYQGVEPDYYSQLSSITGQFYDDGRIYYTLAGDSNVYWRYFEPDDGVIGATAYTVGGFDGSTVAGMTRAGSTVYWVDSSDGSLHSIPFDDGTFGSSGETTIDTGGVDWRGQNLFLAPPPRQVTVTTMTCARATVRIGRTDRCTVNVSTKGTKSAPATRPNGRVRVTGSHSGVLTCTLRAVKTAGHARCAVALRPHAGTAGTHRLTGRYDGDAAHNPSHGTHTVRVLPAAK